MSPRALSGSTPPASVPNFIHGWRICIATFESDAMNRSCPSRSFSASVRSMITSGQGFPIACAIWPSRSPSYRLSESTLNPTTSTPAGVAERHRFSHAASGRSISTLIAARVGASPSRSSSLPSACASGGMHDDRPFAPAV